MIASTGSVTVHRHGNSISYSVLGCVLLLVGTFLSVSHPLCDVAYSRKVGKEKFSEWTASTRR